MTSTIYLDSNASTPPLPEVIEEVARVMRDCYGNPGSRHRAGRKARQVLEECRENIAAWLGASPTELIFTSGGTEANNLAIRGFAPFARRTSVGSGNLSRVGSRGLEAASVASRLGGEADSGRVAG
jgi:cysteine sulfinate desulfinase/cysteine desulfurase-like protein